jgi:hypothetical protein
MRILAAGLAALALAQADVDESQFRFERTLDATAGETAVRIEPDGPLYAHAAQDLADLRIVDASGRQVPWRPEPKPAAVPSRSVPLVARGRRGDVVTVVLDRGPAAPVVDRIELEIPDRTFVGTAVVQGSQTGAEGSYGRLSTTRIYSVRGAVSARSATAVFPPTDHRYLLVQARGVSDVTGARVARDPEQAPLERVDAEVQRQDVERATVVELDLGFRNVPVDAVRVRSRTPTYVRGVTVDSSNDGRTFTPVARGEIAKFSGVDLSRVVVGARARFVRVSIRNGDDQPLAGIDVWPEAERRPILLAGGFEPPFTVYYGARALAAPSYDFAQLPPRATGFEQARPAVLGPERRNEAFEPPTDTRTFFERNDELIQVALVLAAIVVAVGGFLALRRRTSDETT